MGLRSGPARLRARASGELGKTRTQPAERGRRTVPRESGPQAYGVRWTSSTRGDCKWAEKAVGVSMRGNSFSRQCGEKGSGVLGRGTKDSRRGHRKSGRWRPPRPTDVIRWDRSEVPGPGWTGPRRRGGL